MGFSFYRVDTNYCDFLRKYDPRVPYTMADKATRPFIGIVLSVQGKDYYAPLSSPKPKHLKMKNQIDFLKINGGAWGAINFNNMIPVHDVKLYKIDLKVNATDTKDMIDYKNLLINQDNWCTANKQVIIKQAEKLYNMHIGNTLASVVKNRCCDFKKLEQACDLYYYQNYLKNKCEYREVSTTSTSEKMLEQLHKECDCISMPKGAGYQIAIHKDSIVRADEIIKSYEPSRELVKSR